MKNEEKFGFEYPVKVNRAESEELANAMARDICQKTPSQQVEIVFEIRNIVKDELHLRIEKVEKELEYLKSEYEKL